jgi:phosphoribosylformylglycinamidine cyclo-ligase
MRPDEGWAIARPRRLRFDLVSPGSYKPAVAMTYESSGVDYGPLDAFKRACQAQARTTLDALGVIGANEPASVRGDSAYLLEFADHYLAHVEEGLGTKNLVADAMAKASGQCFYRAIGIDTVATIVNDLITCGAAPVSVAMHAAVGSSDWFNDRTRASELAEGFAQGCRQSNAVWGGGETPTLSGIVEPSTIVLAGSATGRIAPKSNRITGDVRPDDAIVFLASTGVHTNGLTLCRKLAERLPEGYLTPISDGHSFGEALLAPSAIYARFVALCQQRGIPVGYLVHMTGHGWRKLMRLDADFGYEVDAPPIPALFQFLIDRGPVEVREAYATFNMGVGFAAMVRPEAAEACVKAATDAGHHAWIGGRVTRSSARAVRINNLAIEFQAQTLAVR